MLVDQSLDLVLHAKTQWQEMENARVSLAKEACAEEEIMAVFLNGCFFQLNGRCPEVA